MSAVVRTILVFLAASTAASVIAVAAPGEARATWCWPSPYPNCSASYGILGIGTTTGNGCWYAYSEVCSGYNYFINNAIVKLCYPWQDCPLGDTGSTAYYGFENADRIRGRYTFYSGTFNIQPTDVGMGGYLRAQAKWDYGCCGNDNLLRVSALT